MNKNFHLMCKPTSSQCNLHCDYCFYLEKKRYIDDKKSPLAMTDDVLKTYINAYIQSQSTPVIEFAWQGGEPTLAGLDYFKKIIEYQYVYANGKKIKNTFQTNGLLLNHHWASFFAQHDFLIGISIDGCAVHHNQYRLTPHGKGTFDKVTHAIALLNEFNVDYNTLTVVNNHNMNEGKVIYAFLKSIGSYYHQYIPVIEVVAPCFEKRNIVGQFTPSGSGIKPFSVSRQGYGRFLVDVFDQWVKEDVGNVFIQQFDATLASWLGYGSSSCVFNKTCGQNLIIERNGDIYSCDHYVYPDFKIGNMMNSELTTLCNSQQQQVFAQAKSLISSQCKQCEFLFACYGGCTKHRIDFTSAGEKQNYLCQSYLFYFQHVKKYMNFMVNELNAGRNVFDVMKFAKQSIESK